ncbi:unnamed protein product [Rotaria socialis]|uniref:TNF receptor-associated factor n=1 Tax=Rotaria socialis TaxID=392032 RepID=A0A818FLF1_9BILA|nr:unnamed protein product [Rotaria socialis]CAF3476889.1 unnamed protein product [Rotaria socialis]CAF3514367.1 unnamed protein product [Rotaria socialis]CAF3718355.1 unnamed protein product [Rotaria socialis]CAF4215933.1 unnamed protein product [Rotaria socialis]
MVDSCNSQLSNERVSSFSISPYPKCGFDVDDIENKNSRFKCIFCSLLIQEPIQLVECGHRSCRGCFEARAAVAPDENVTCPYDDCNIKTNKSQIMPDKAFKKELDILKVACVHRRDKQCNWEGLLNDYQSHLDRVHMQSICLECNESFSSQAILNEHIRKTCPRIFAACPLSPLCTEEMIRKTDFIHHVFSGKHQETISKFLIGEYHFPESSTQEQDMELDAIDTELEEKISQQIANLSRTTQIINDKTIEITNGFTSLNERFSTIVQEVSNAHSSILEKIPIKRSIQPSQVQLQKDIENLQQICTASEYISTDGVLTWRIEHVSEKMADAQSERQTSILSPVFYSSHTGYKMRAKLFLFGDGNARRTHVSLFFVLMKGEYDAILKWPFQYKVTFCLLDQTGNNRHIIDSFYPDVKSTSFQRPVDEANIASGIPRFVSLNLLLQDDSMYVRDDTTYIKIIVTLNETPKLLLPFVLTLNPALPNHVQENLVKQEIVRRQQQPTTTDNSQSTPMNI